MKLHSLKITGMGPFAGTESIDFDRLGEAGVYLLTGRTGSGKTSVLDAVSYAIFGEVPRNAKGGDLVSHHRETGTTPMVVLEATIAGRRQRITRSPQHERPSKRGQGTTEQAQTVLVEDFSDGEWHRGVGGWKDVNELLAARIGMNADQFNQVVMLPQGKFEKFLDASADDRRKLLQRLFPGTDLEWLENWLKREADRVRELRDAKLDQIGQRFQRVLPIARKLAPDDEAGEEPGQPLPSHLESGPAIRWIDQIGEQLERGAETREQARAEAHQTWDEAAAELRRLENRADLIKRRNAADRELARLGERRDWRRDSGARIEAARRAATVRSLAETATIRRQEWEAAAAERGRLAPLMAGDPLTAVISEGEHEAHRDQLKSEAQQVHDFIRNELSRRAGLEVEVEKLTGSLVALSATGPGSRIGQAKQLVEQRAEAAARATRKYLDIREARTRGMARELADGLEVGVPCPVCGSTHHPAPAEGADEIPTEGDEKQAESARSEAKDAEATAEKELAEVQRKTASERATSEATLDGHRGELQRLRDRETELSAGIPEIEDRHEKLVGAVKLLDDYLDADRGLRTAKFAADRATGEAAAEAKARDFDSVDTALAAGMEPVQLDQLQAQTAEFDGQLKVVEDRLAGELAAVDPTETVELGPAVAAEKKAAEARERATRESGTADEDRDRFRSETDPVPALYAELAPLREAADRVSELYRLASGTNERHMRLSIFFLATRLQQVIEAANSHLAAMTDQRYTLVYFGEAEDGRSQSGLDIGVFDSHTSEARPTGTLSGGEKFCAALSLALGLAEVVQTEANGKSLETLFIDEGFGTLDAKSLDQVMTVIDSLREGGRSVGLVSHVEELRDRITAQIQVTASREGSTLKVSTG